MPANFILAKKCQLFRKDVDGVLTLAAQLLLSTTPNNHHNNSSTTSSSTEASASSSRLQAGPLIGAVLTEAGVRSLLLNTLVRVLVPAPRHAALLQDNKYVQLANEVAKQQLQEQQQQTAQGKQPSSNGEGGASKATAAFSLPSEQEQHYRVGRVVGVVPKPAAKASAAAADAAQRWLLAVYVGECVEPVTVSALSEDAFTETEHRIFVQSALSTVREDGSRRASVLPSQQPVLLSAETAATVQQNIQDLRRVLNVVDATQNEESAAAAMVDAGKTAVLERASGVKRPRDHNSSHNGDDDDAEKVTAAEEDGGSASSSLVSFFGNGAASQAAHLARLTDDVAARGQQLQQLRQLLQQKEQEVKSTLQQQQQREAQHRGEVDVWRAKVEEQSRAQQRAATEAADALEQRNRLLEEANTKLRRLAEMTGKYKRVVDAVAALLKRGSEDGGDGRGAGKSMGPEEILAALQHKKLV